MAAGDKRPDQLLEFKKRTGPAMDQHQRQAGTIAPGMDKMKPLPLNFRGKLSEPVQPGFLHAPIVSAQPIVDQPPKIRNANTAFPSAGIRQRGPVKRSEEHTSELQSLMRISYAVFCLKKKNKQMKNCNKKTATQTNTRQQ